MATYSTLAEAVGDLARRGFTANFEVKDGSLRAVESGRSFSPEALTIMEHHRFEGASDPDDMAVVYAIAASDGTRGVLVDAYGAYANPDVSALLKDVPVR